MFVDLFFFLFWVLTFCYKMYLPISKEVEKIVHDSCCKKFWSTTPVDILLTQIIELEGSNGRLLFWKKKTLFLDKYFSFYSYSTMLSYHAHLFLAFSQLS